MLHEDSLRIPTSRARTLLEEAKRLSADWVVTADDKPDLTLAPIAQLEKDGEFECVVSRITRKLDNFEMLLQIPGLRPMLDTSRSIGRRYARADEIGIPWSVTIDHQTLEDETVTIRRRDDQVQVRVARAALVPAFTHGHVASLFG